MCQGECLAETSSPHDLQGSEHSYTVENQLSKKVCQSSTTNKNPIETTSEDFTESVVVNLDAPSNKKNPVSSVSNHEEPTPESLTKKETQPSIDPDTQDSSDTPVVESDESIDYKELIAEIDNEMCRLGWSTNQGVDYIQKHYGVKSRVKLDDVQLIKFWNHLKGLGN